MLCLSPGCAISVKTVPVTKRQRALQHGLGQGSGHIVQDATVEVQTDLAGVVDSVSPWRRTPRSGAGDPLLYIKRSESQPR